MEKDKGGSRMGLTRDIAKDLFYHLGMAKSILWFLRISGHTKWFIFTYHRVSCASRDNGYLAVPSDVFEEHIRFIKNNFKTVSMLEGLKALKEGNSKEIHATINLDDGYMDNYLHAYPVLKKYRVPATIFLSTDFIGKRHAFWWDRVFEIVSSLNISSLKLDIDSRTLRFRLDGMQQRARAVDVINHILRNKNERERESFIKDLKARYNPVQNRGVSEMLSWNEIREMHGNLVDFGTHTKTHRDLCMLDDDEVLKELVESKKEIEEKLGMKVTEFSYPFGTFNERIKALVKKAGFAYARTAMRGFNRSNTDRFLLNSIIVADSLSKASFLASRVLITSLKSCIHEKNIFC